MSTSEFDSLRPPEPAGGKRRDGKRTGRSGGADGSREMPMVPEAEFTSYYGRPVVKPAPWGHEVAAYLFLGGVAGGSGLLAAGAQLTGRTTLRRNARLSALVAVALGAVALVKDLGRPERFVNMLRTVKLTSPMSLGSWILSAFSAGIGVAAVVRGRPDDRRATPAGPVAAGAARGGGTGRTGSRGFRAAARGLHGGAAHRHRDPDVERRATKTCRSCSSARRAWPHRAWR